MKRQKTAKNPIIRIRDWLSLFWDLFSKRRDFGVLGFKMMLDREISRKKYALTEQELAQQFLYVHAKFLNPESQFQLSYAGPPCDGGYFYLDIFPTPTLVSGGAGKNIDFEKSFSARGSKVYLFDGTVRTDSHDWGDIQFVSKNIGMREGPNHLSLSQFFFGDSVSHKVQNAGLGLYLKLDIEGSEYEVLSSLTGNLSKFDQLIIEFHELYKLGNPDFREAFSEVIAELKRDFVSISFRSNNWDSYINFGDAFVPNTFELTLLNTRHLSKLVLSQQTIPEHLNNPKRLPIPNAIFVLETDHFT